MSDTPRTDAAEFCYRINDDPTLVVESGFARELERELNELSTRLQERTAAYEAKDAKQVKRIQWLEANLAATEKSLKIHQKSLRLSQELWNLIPDQMKPSCKDAHVPS